MGRPAERRASSAASPASTRILMTRAGYRRPEAEYAVCTLGARVDTEPLAELVQEALGVLARRPAPGPRPKER
jgi:hypothetical protein